MLTNAKITNPDFCPTNDFASFQKIQKKKFKILKNSTLKF